MGQPRHPGLDGDVRSPRDRGPVRRDRGTRDVGHPGVHEPAAATLGKRGPRGRAGPQVRLRARGRQVVPGDPDEQGARRGLDRIEQDAGVLPVRREHQVEEGEGQHGVDTVLREGHVPDEELPRQRQRGRRPDARGRRGVPEASRPVAGLLLPYGGANARVPERGRGGLRSRGHVARDHVYRRGPGEHQEGAGGRVRRLRGEGRRGLVGLLDERESRGVHRRIRRPRGLRRPAAGHPQVAGVHAGLPLQRSRVAGVAGLWYERVRGVARLPAEGERPGCPGPADLGPRLGGLLGGLERARHDYGARPRVRDEHPGPERPPRGQNCRGSRAVRAQQLPEQRRDAVPDGDVHEADRHAVQDAEGGRNEHGFQREVRRPRREGLHR